VLNIIIMTSYLAWSSKRVSHLISTHSNIMISIINQIQASITSEAVDRLDEYEENVTERQRDTDIQDRT
jgi:23S rRNA maturation mini-RNase III